ncbi:protein PLANT CADMIUM RESISTANCE 7-like isoform X2 [Bidens hawaiensis]|uniref:protein PLANT CADMIUM RESISTANCE 7-like isoform X2 n=1 Tax=Bidens hawaiensis TaxID=980011 RepID=UPI00404AEF2B
MADSGSSAAALEENERLIDFDKLCSTVAMKTNQGKWNTLEEVYDDDGGGVFRMWEGDVLDCFDDRNLVLQSSFCPWYRFGENMRLAGFGSCFLQGFIYIILATIALCNFVAFTITKKPCFLYLAVAFALSFGAYSGFHRSKMRKKFNIKGSDSCLDDCISHLVCPCCTLAQESRTLEMNNVHDGTWHGRGDTTCIGTYVEGVKALELIPPLTISIEPSKP